MKNWNALGLLGAALLLPGCIFVDDDNDDGYYVPTGALTVEWTIAGDTDPVDCAAFDVDRFELVIYDETDEVVDVVDPPCEAFGVTVDLLEGFYSADATLVDGFDRSATVTEPINSIRIVADSELVIPVDYPPGSFL